MTKEEKQKSLDLEEQLKILQQLHNLKDEATFRYQLIQELVGIRTALEEQAEATKELVTLSSEDDTK